MKKLKDMRVFNEKYIYPKSVTTVNVNTLYISAPMSSVSEFEYYDLRDFLLSLKPILEKIGFTRIICPHYYNPDYNNFDGSTKAIKENFIELKQVDSMIVVYPESAPSSVLVEIGYGIALCKKMIIFYKEDVPFILKDAGNNISHIDSRKYSNYDEITHIIKSNGEQLFKYDEED